MTHANDLISAMNYAIDEVTIKDFPHHGLTKREYFAAMALQGLLANTNNSRNPIHANDAVAMADALIKALNQTPQP